MDVDGKAFKNGYLHLLKATWNPHGNRGASAKAELPS